MSSATRKILDDALALPEGDRIELAEALFESVNEAPIDISPEWSEEIARRLKRLAQGDSSSKDAHEHLRSLRTKLG